MIPRAFDYEKPTRVEDAVGLLGQHGSDARILAGGQSLLVWLKTRAVAPRLLVDIAGLADLRGISRDDGSLAIGALTTQRELTESKETGHAFPMLAQNTDVLGDPIIRNRGTFAGSIACADPAADWPALALALGAQVRAQSTQGTRTVPIEEFFVDAFTTALKPTELLTRVTIPFLQGQPAMAYRKLRHPASGYAIVGVAAVLDRADDGTCRDCRVAITGAGRRPIRSSAVENALHGQLLTPETIAQAAEHAPEGLDLQGDAFAGPEYRAQLARTYVKRALLAALDGSTAQNA